jgi:hypothetical protein
MATEPVSTKRPKGYVTWKPHKKTKVVLDNVLEIFQMYQDHLPLTNRQIFYRLVGAYDYPKEEKAYNRLCEYLVRARRSGKVPFSYIRDDGTINFPSGGYYGEKSFWDEVISSADRYNLDRNFFQDQKIEVWCEAGGMVPQLHRVALPYGVPVYSTGGFSSVTVTHEISQRVVRDNRPTVFLHIGDYDPSGQSIYEAMSEDVETFVYQLKAAKDKYDFIQPDCDFYYDRVALTASQVDEYNLPTAPPKVTDSRTERWVGQTCQAEAMAPDDLANLLKGAILEHINTDLHEEILDWEEKDRTELRAMLRGLPIRDLEDRV